VKRGSMRDVVRAERQPKLPATWLVELACGHSVLATYHRRPKRVACFECMRHEADNGGAA
jgi:hypothetical protein